jgi:hypothetical protein
MTVKILAFLSILYACYIGWMALKFLAPFWFLWAVILAGCGMGLIRRRKWAKWLWYACSASVSLSWLSSVIPLAIKGWSYEDFAHTIISLIPGALLLFICIGGSFAVRRQYALHRH